MSHVALLRAGVATPGIKKQLFLQSLWVTVRVASRGEWQPEDVSVEEEGAKAPVERPRKRLTRRGRRGARRSATAKRSTRLAPRPDAGKAVRRERGSGSRSNHFVASFERSASRLCASAKQIVDIKRRASERQASGLKPALPHKAAIGLARRQSSVRRAAAFWGDRYAKWAGVPREQGRDVWRTSLYRASATGPELSLSLDSTSVVASAAAAEDRERTETARDGPSRRVCRTCGYFGPIATHDYTACLLAFYDKRDRMAAEAAAYASKSRRRRKK